MEGAESAPPTEPVIEGGVATTSLSEVCVCTLSLSCSCAPLSSHSQLPPSHTPLLRTNPLCTMGEPALDPLCTMGDPVLDPSLTLAVTSRPQHPPSPPLEVRHS